MGVKLVAETVAKVVARRKWWRDQNGGKSGGTTGVDVKLVAETVAKVVAR